MPARPSRAGISHWNTFGAGWRPRERLGQPEAPTKPRFRFGEAESRLGEPFGGKERCPHFGN